MKHNGMLLVTDLDGTLLTSDKRITAKSKDAVLKLRDSGGDITIATGRSVESARKYVDEIGIELPVIVYNGVMIYDYKSEKPLWNDCLTENAKQYALKILERFPCAGMEVLRRDKIYVINDNSYVREHIDIEKLENVVCGIDDVPFEWYKILMALDPKVIPEVQKFVKEEDFADVYFVRTSECYFEMLPKGSCKGNALKQLCRITGHDILNTAAVGDYNNDCEMIEYSKIGGAMGTAPESVKDSADIIVSSSDDNGFAEFVRYAMGK